MLRIRGLLHVSAQTMQPNSWNSLEIAKLVAGILTPIALAALGIYLHRLAKRFEYLQWRNQKLTEKDYRCMTLLLQNSTIYFATSHMSVRGETCHQLPS